MPVALDTVTNRAEGRHVATAVDASATSLTTIGVHHAPRDSVGLVIGFTLVQFSSLSRSLG